jgi:hypothetical protein
MDKQQMAEGIHALAEKLKSERGLSLSKIADAGGQSRQAFYQSHARDDITTLRVTGFGLSVIAAAVQNGYIAEAMTVLMGNEMRPTTVLIAALMYPDLKPEEMQLLLGLEETLNTSPLPTHFIQSLIQTHRTPKP